MVAMSLSSQGSYVRLTVPPQRLIRRRARSRLSRAARPPPCENTARPQPPAGRGPARNLAVELAQRGHGGHRRTARALPPQPLEAKALVQRVREVRAARDPFERNVPAFAQPAPLPAQVRHRGASALGAIG